MLRESSDGYSSVPQEEPSCDMSYTTTRPYKNKSKRDCQVVTGIVVILAILFSTFVAIFYATRNKEIGASTSSQLHEGELSKIDTFDHGFKKPEFTADDHEKASTLEQDDTQKASTTTTQKSTSPGRSTTAKNNMQIMPTFPYFLWPFDFKETSSRSPEEQDNDQVSSPTTPAKDQVNENTTTSAADSVEVIEHSSDAPDVQMTTAAKEEHTVKDNETLLEDENTQNTSNETAESDQFSSLENLLNAIYGVPNTNVSKPTTDGTTKWMVAINQAPPLDVGIAIAAAVSTLALFLLTVVVIVCVVKRHRRRKQRQESIQSAIADLQVRDKVVLLNSEDSEE